MHGFRLEPMPIDLAEWLQEIPKATLLDIFWSTLTHEQRKRWIEAYHEIEATEMTKTKYHAVLLDETRCEFGADIEAHSKDEAHDLLREAYPESKVVQLESPEDTHRREHRMYQHILAGGDWDDEGRPIFHYPPDDDE